MNNDIEVHVLAVELVPISGRFFVKPDEDAPSEEVVESVHTDWVPHIVRHPSGAHYACVGIPAEVPENARELWWY